MWAARRRVRETVRETFLRNFSNEQKCSNSPKLPNAPSEERRPRRFGVEPMTSASRFPPPHYVRDALYQKSLSHRTAKGLLGNTLQQQYHPNTLTITGEAKNICSGRKTIRRISKLGRGRVKSTKMSRGVNEKAQNFGDSAV